MAIDYKKNFFGESWDEEEWQALEEQETEQEREQDTEPEEEAVFSGVTADEEAVAAPRRPWVFRLLLSLFLGLLVSLLLLHTWAGSEATRLGFAYAQALHRGDRLQEERRRLQLQLESLRDLARLSRIANQELGMQLPSRVQVIYEDSRERLAHPLRRDERIAASARKKHFLARYAE